MNTQSLVVLASGSKIRQTILRNAGIEFEVLKGAGDEVDPRAGEDAKSYVVRCAEAKARDCLASHGAEKLKDRLVIGCDQVVEFEGSILRKVNNADAAVSRLVSFQKAPHKLVNGLVILKNGEVVHRSNHVVQLTLRNLPEAQLRRYIDLEQPMSSVACYYLEGMGIKLIDQFEGDYFSALGLPVRTVAEVVFSETNELFA